MTDKEKKAAPKRATKAPAKGAKNEVATKAAKELKRLQGIGQVRPNEWSPEVEEKARVGRPSSFTPELAEAVCMGIMAGYGLRTVCASKGMPSPSMVYRWLHVNKQFREQYMRARDIQSHVLVDEVVDIADNAMCEKDAIQKARVMIDARMRMAAKLNPKVYGDKIDLSSTDGSMVSKPSMIKIVAGKGNKS